MIVASVQVFCSACASDDLKSVAEQRAVWERSKPSQYVIEVCETGFAPTSCVQTAVSGGQVVVARSRPALGAGPWTDLTTVVDEPVEALFLEVEGAPAECDAPQVEYDAEYGFVSEYSVWCRTDGSGKTVTCFAPNTNDLAQCPSG